MPKWDTEYCSSLKEKFDKITEGLDERLEDVVLGRVVRLISVKHLNII
jgi:hypothetical protein